MVFIFIARARWHLMYTKIVFIMVWLITSACHIICNMYMMCWYNTFVRGTPRSLLGNRRVQRAFTFKVKDQYQNEDMIHDFFFQSVHLDCLKFSVTCNIHFNVLKAHIITFSPSPIRFHSFLFCLTLIHFNPYIFKISSTHLLCGFSFIHLYSSTSFTHFSN